MVNWVFFEVLIQKRTDFGECLLTFESVYWLLRYWFRGELTFESVYWFLEPCLAPAAAMAHVWRSLTRGMSVCDVTRLCVWHDSFICATWLIHMCDMTHWYVRHDSLICATWLIHMCDMTHSYTWAMGHVCRTLTRGMCVWDVTRSYVWHDWFICAPWLIRSLTRGICVCDVMRGQISHYISRSIRLMTNLTPRLMTKLTAHDKCAV